MEFVLILLIFPFIAFIFGVVGSLFIKNTFIVGAITFIICFIATFTVLNSSFLIWVFVYTILTVIGSLIVNCIRKYKKIR